MACHPSSPLVPSDTEASQQKRTYTYTPHATVLGRRQLQRRSNRRNEERRDEGHVPGTGRWMLDETHEAFGTQPCNPHSQSTVVRVVV